MGVTAHATDRRAIEQRFSLVFDHLGFVIAYLRRRGAADPEAIAAEVMTIAWRRLADVPVDDPRPWLIAAARNLHLAEWRRRSRERSLLDALGCPKPTGPPPASVELDPPLEAALRLLSMNDREALILIAWEELTPAEAAASLGISPAAFRVRLHRARRRLADALSHTSTTSQPKLCHT